MKLSAELLVDLGRKGLLMSEKGKKERRDRREGESEKGAGATEEKGEEGKETEGGSGEETGRLWTRGRDFKQRNGLVKIRRRRGEQIKE